MWQHFNYWSWFLCITWYCLTYMTLKIHHHREAWLILELLYVPTSIILIIFILIPLHTISYPSIFHIMFVCKLGEYFDIIMHVILQFCKTLYTNTRLISKNVDIQPTLESTLFQSTCLWRTIYLDPTFSISKSSIIISKKAWLS
jgi:hypothetical protein